MSGEGLIEVVRVVGERAVPVLLHSLWQGGAVAAVLWTALKVTPGGAARRRHAMSLCALVAVVVCVAGTWAWLGRGEVVGGGAELLIEVKETGPNVPRVVEGVPVSGPVGARVTWADAPDVRIGSWVIDWKQWAGVAWMVGAAWGLGKCLIDLAGAGLLMRSATRVEDPAWQDALRQMCAALGIGGRVRLALSDRVRVPMVAGFFSPMVLIPGFAAPGLTGEELRLILAHELAHVRRHDLWIGLFQAVVEALLFFNPAVRWISRQVRAERECCCDQDAMKVCPAGTVAYAQMLANWMAQDVWVAGRMTVGMRVDGGRPGGVLERVGRLLFPARFVSRRLPVWAVACGVAGVLLVVAGVGLAAQAAVRTWTPQERVDAVAKAAPVDDGTRWFRGPLERRPVKVVVNMKAAPGATLSPGGLLKIRSQLTGGMSMAHTHITTSLTLGRYERELDAGLMWAWLIDKGTGITVVGPVLPTPDAKVVPLEIEAGRGRRYRIRVVDNTGAPVADARVTAQVTFGDALYRLGDPTMWRTDREGVVEVAVDSPVEVALRVFGKGMAPGTVKIASGDAVEKRLVLAPAKVTTGRLVWAKTGVPAAGLDVSVVAYHWTGKTRTEPVMSLGAGLTGDSLSTPVKTDGEGRFALDELEEEWAYRVVARDAAGTTVAVKDFVAAGQGLGDMPVGPVTIRGKVLDPYGLMGAPGAKMRLGISHGTGKGVYNTSDEVAIKKNGAGELVFEIGPMVAQQSQLQFYSPQRRDLGHAGFGELNLVAGEEREVVVDLSAERFKPIKEVPVAFRVQVPKGEPAPVGAGVVWASGRYWGELNFSAQDKGVKTVMLPMGSEVYIGEIWFPGFMAVSARKPFNVPGDGSLFEKVIELKPAGAVVGKVVRADGTPWPYFRLEYAQVGFWGTESKATPAQVTERDAQLGRFTVKDMELGKAYVVRVKVKSAMGVETVYKLGPYVIARDKPVREAEIVVGNVSTPREGEKK